MLEQDVRLEQSQIELPYQARADNIKGYTQQLDEILGGHEGKGYEAAL